MLPDDKSEHKILRDLILENQRLVTENNQLLKKMHRQSVWSFWFRVVSFLVLLGVPFVLYYYVIEPYFTTLGSSFETFQSSLQEVPGWKQFYEAVGDFRNKGE